MEELGGLQTEFNSSFHSLGRLNYLLALCNEYSRDSNQGGYNIESLNQWKLLLLDIYREIYPKMNDAEIKIIEDTIKLYRRCHSLYYRVGPPHDTQVLVSPVGFAQRWKINDRLEKRLRKMADKKGMLITNKDSAEWSLR